MDEPILLQVGTCGTQGSGMKLSVWESGGQRLRSQEVEVRLFDLAEGWVSFLTPLGRVGF